MSNLTIRTTKDSLPAAATGSAVLGIEGLDDRDGVLPRIMLLNDKAILLKNMQKKKIDGAIAGVFVNTANENEPLHKINFIPAYMTKFYDLYDMGGDKKRWLFRTLSQLDPRLQGKRWKGETNEHGVKLKAEVQTVYSVVAVLEGNEPFPVVINFKGGSVGAGKNLYTMARKSGKALYASKYALTSYETSGDNPYYAMRVEALGDADEVEIERARSVYQAFSGQASKLANNAEEDAGEDVGF